MELEEILEKKDFCEEAKNLLLNIFYKIENFYDDYKLVKRQVEDKSKFIETILKFISEDCNNIEIINPKEKKRQVKYKISKDGVIKTFPDESILLYAIVKNSMNNRQKIKDLKNESLIKTLNAGKSASFAEVVRDFNGWSWNNMLEDKNVINQNLIYQNLIILLEYYNMEKILNNENASYVNELQMVFSEMYEKENCRKFLVNLYNACIFIRCMKNKNLKIELIKQKELTEKIISKIQDKTKFLNIVTKEKWELTKKIKELDRLLNDENLLEYELKKRNEKITRKINLLKMNELIIILESERKSYLRELKDYNQLMDPKKYMIKKQELENNYEFYNQLEIDEKKNININKAIIKLQLLFLECFKEKVSKCTTRMNMINIIYEFRYYRFLKYKEDKLIKDEEKLKMAFEEIEDIIIKKGQEIKIFEKYSTNQEFSKIIINEIFNTKILKLENVSFKIIEENEKQYIQYYDGNIEEIKKELSIKNENQKLKKKNKIII